MIASPNVTPTAAVTDPASVSRPDPFGPFRAAWNTEDAAHTPTSQFIWLTACAASLADGQLDIVVAERDNQPVALAPFVVRSNGLWRYWTLLGEGLYEPSDVIYRDPDALDHLALALLRRGEPLHFDRLFYDSPTIGALQRLSPRRAILACRPAPSCPFIPLDKSWLTPEANLNAKRRSDLRRAQRHAEQIGPITTEILTPAVYDVDQLLNTALDVEARSWKGDEKTAMLQDDYRRPFYLQYARAACQAGLLRLCFLRIANQPVAMQIAIQSADSLWLLKIGYDNAYARCSPGALLIRDTIRYAAETGLHTYEFLGRVEPWTQIWTKDEHPCVTLDVYPYSVRGMAVYARSLASAAKQKWKNKKP